MTFSLGSIRAVLDIDESGYARGILNAQGLTKVFGESFTTFLVNPVVGGIGALKNLAGAAVGMARDVLESAESIQRLSDQTGVAAETLQALRAEFDIAGRSIEVADRASRNFSLRMGQAKTGSNELANAFRSLSPEALRLEDTDEAMRRIISRLAEMEDQSKANALAAKIFGEEAGPQLLQTIGGNLDAIIEKRTKLGQVFSSEIIDNLARFNTTIGTTGQLFDGLARSAVVNFLSGLVGEIQLADESIEDLAGRLNSLVGSTFQELGSDIGNLVGNLDELVEGLTRFVEILGLVKTIGSAGFRGIRDGLTEPEDEFKVNLDDTRLFQLLRPRPEGEFTEFNLEDERLFRLLRAASIEPSTRRMRLLE